MSKMQKPVTVAISKEQLSQLPVVDYHGEIIVVDKVEAVASAMEYLRSQRLVGIDTETRPSFKKGRTYSVALMQIASLEKCYLFRINKIGFVKELHDFMEDESVVKVGLSLKDDFHVLHKIAEFEPHAYVELQSLVKEYCISDASLQKIYGILFGGRISKSQRLSNWEASVLTHAQQLYAALDARACLDIYMYLKSGRFVPQKSPYAVDLDCLSVATGS